MDPPLAIGKRKVDDDDNTQQRQQMQPVSMSPKRWKTDTFCFLPFHLKVLKSLYNDTVGDNKNDNKKLEAPGLTADGDDDDETWEMLATRFLKSRENLWQAKQEALRCRAVSTQAQHYAQEDDCYSTRSCAINRRRQRHRQQRQRRPLHHVPAMMLRKPLFTTTSAYYTAASAVAVVSPLFPPPPLLHQQERTILSNTTTTPRTTSSTFMMSSPFKVGTTTDGHQQLPPKTTSSFRIVAALLKQQSSSVQENLETQLKPFRPLLEMAEKRITLLVASLQEQRRVVLEMEEFKMDDLLLSTSATTTSRRRRCSRGRPSSCHDLHQQGGEPKEDCDVDMQQKQNSYLAATESKICLWNMLALDLKAIIIVASSED
jgi:hypothetical protein